MEITIYRDVPGVDTAYLAMDTEEGVEVVWNEAIFSGSKKFKNKEEDKLKNVFEALTLIDHPNIVKFHRFWTDEGTYNEKSGQKDPPRVRPVNFLRIRIQTNLIMFCFFSLFLSLSTCLLDL